MTALDDVVKAAQQRKAWTRKLSDAVVAASDDRYTWQEIAEAAGMHRNSVQLIYRRAMGDPPWRRSRWPRRRPAVVQVAQQVSDPARQVCGTSAESDRLALVQGGDR